MNTSILNTEMQEFINSHLNSDVMALLLKGMSFPSVEAKEVIEQIEAKKRCEKKLPTWFSCKKIYYPSKLNIEQTSSEVTAKYKASLISGVSIIDLTGGFGVDCSYFSKVFKTATHCEINENLSKIVTHNYKQLGIDNIDFQNIDGIDYLKASEKQFNWIYIDPSRRHDSKGKVFFLKDCLPNVPEHIDLLFAHSKNIMIKTSPLLDLSVGINELKHVKTIHIVAVNNEVKELLWVLENNFKGDISIETVNIKKEAKVSFSFSIANEKKSESKYHTPLTYLYEPNSAILKAGAFHSISNQLNVYKLHKHSHLYTSHSLIDFPGRSFKIESMALYNKKELKKLGISKANITVRNFPETVQQIRKKFNVRDGGELYLFFTTDMDDNKIILVTSKLD
ncbi:THUMP-like domain-containing protein [Flavivirga spongiicola]|uniref:Class I SAM-dependent methyltransferase n=1 Tax=Flavivirga spongiicola TaxID=421621 RepID=A0ABU7XX01_9FLAO|nr:class I SAM-dependent methyltransferase [Flavivirga sp. MEBiC05379]MDO5980287.1 class I SAM-dependent methyltransferase [Flavivirga sp. MEBiC05379]